MPELPPDEGADGSSDFFGAGAEEEDGLDEGAGAGLAVELEAAGLTNFAAGISAAAGAGLTGSAAGLTGSGAGVGCSTTVWNPWVLVPTTSPFWLTIRTSVCTTKSRWACLCW